MNSSKLIVLLHVQMQNFEKQHLKYENGNCEINVAKKEIVGDKNTLLKLIEETRRYLEKQAHFDKMFQGLELGKIYDYLDRGNPGPWEKKGYGSWSRVSRDISLKPIGIN